jgi:hybrid cluster-associated redox disulfide protein
VIAKDTPIIDVLRMFPSAREIFARHGMSCIGCMGSTSETIDKAARMHDVNLELLLQELNKARNDEMTK